MGNTNVSHSSCISHRSIRNVTGEREDEDEEDEEEEKEENACMPVSVRGKKERERAKYVCTQVQHNYFSTSTTHSELVCTERRHIRK